MINQFSKVADYKINVQKTVVFLHTSNGLTNKKSGMNSHSQ